LVNASLAYPGRRFPVALNTIDVVAGLMDNMLRRHCLAGKGLKPKQSSTLCRILPDPAIETELFLVGLLRPNRSGT